MINQTGNQCSNHNEYTNSDIPSIDELELENFTDVIIEESEYYS